MADRRRWNRRSFKFAGIDPKDGEKTYYIIRFKLKDKSFARPIILNNKQSEDHFLNQWRKNGWKEGQEW